MSNDSLGDRMKGYENISRIYLPRRLPVIIRVDGRAFHTLTRGLKKPFDAPLASAMRVAAFSLCKEISGAKLAYVQSDEISVLVTNNDRIETQPWFDNNLQKLVSLSASIASVSFTTAIKQEAKNAWVYATRDDECAYAQALENMAFRAIFDARAFVLPSEEVCNYFIWRQQDATRNSIQMVAQSLYSHKELQNKNCDELQEMIFQKGINWNDYETRHKRGVCCIKEPTIIENTVDPLSNSVEPIIRKQWVVDVDIPVFTQDRDYIERWLKHDDP